MARNNRDDRLTFRGASLRVRTRFAYWAKQVERVAQWQLFEWMLDLWMYTPKEDRDKTLKIAAEAREKQETGDQK